MNLVSLWDHDPELRAMNLNAVHRHVDENFLFTDNADLDGSTRLYVYCQNGSSLACTETRSTGP